MPVLEKRSSIFLKCNQDGKVVSCKTYFKTRNPDSMKGQNLFDVLQKKDHKSFRSAVNAALEQQYASAVQVSFENGKTIDAQIIPAGTRGSNHYFILSGTILKNRDSADRKTGGPSGKAATELKKEKEKSARLQQELQLYKTRTDLAMRAGNIGLWEWDVVNDEVYWSDDIGPMFGLPEGEHPENYEVYLQSVHPDDLSVVQGTIQSAFENGGYYHMIHRVVWPDGSVHRLECDGYASKDAEGNTFCMAGTVRDVTVSYSIEQALVESEVNLRAIVENSPDVIMRLKPDGTIVYINYTLSEYSVDQVIGQSVFDFVFGEDVNKYRHAVQSVLQTGERQTFTVTAVDSSMWLLRLSPLVQNDSIVEILVIASDVTEQYRAEQAVVNSENKLRTLVEHAPDIITMIDRNGALLDINHVFPMYRKEEVLGTPMYNYLPEESINDARNAVEKVFTEAVQSSFQCILQADENDYRYIESRLAPVVVEGEVASAIIISTDLTDRVKIEKRLQRSRERFEHLVTTSLDGYWDWPDIGQSGMWWSDRFYELIGYTRDDLESGYQSLNSLVHPADRKSFLKAFDVCIRNRVAFDLDVRLVIKDNGYRWYRMRGRASASAGDPGRVSGSLQDIHELQQYRTHLEQLVSERTRELQAVNRELESFSYSVSHDLRAPLRAIDGFSRILAEEYGSQMDEVAQEYIHRICRNVDRMGHLIDDLLKLSRVTSSPFESENVDMSAAAREIFDKLLAAELNRQTSLKIDTDIMARGDKRLLSIALDNLFSNAMKYTSKTEKPEIVFGQKQEGDRLVYYVQDNGVGFDMKYADKLFGAFQRLHKIDEFPGSGIGLATVQRIIRRHGGEIWAEAQENEGAVFYFTLGQEAG